MLKLIKGKVYTVWNDEDSYKKLRIFQGYYGNTPKFVEFSGQMNQPLLAGKCFDNYENSVERSL